MLRDNEGWRGIAAISHRGVGGLRMDGTPMGVLCWRISVAGKIRAACGWRLKNTSSTVACLHNETGDFLD